MESVGATVIAPASASKAGFPARTPLGPRSPLSIYRSRPSQPPASPTTKKLAELSKENEATQPRRTAPRTPGFRTPGPRAPLRVVHSPSPSSASPSSSSAAPMTPGVVRMTALPVPLLTAFAPVAPSAVPVPATPSTVKLSSSTGKLMYSRSELMNLRTCREWPEEKRALGEVYEAFPCLIPRRFFVATPTKSPCKSTVMQTQPETDPRRLAQRRKQIEYGRNTEGYKRFLQLVPSDKVMRGDPVEPSVELRCSKRSWDGQVRRWRRLLHFFDDVEASLEDIRKRIAVSEAARREQKKAAQASGELKASESDDSDVELEDEGVAPADTQDSL